MSEFMLSKPTLILVYGYPGAGKTFFSRQISNKIGAAHIHDDKLRSELFNKSTLNKDEAGVIDHLTGYMSDEFLKAGVSVVLDVTGMRIAQRRKLREAAIKLKAQCLLVWIQIDADTAFTRVANRDKRKTDDKYSTPLNRHAFDQATKAMQNPTYAEDYVVISGKHSFNTQWHSSRKKFYDMGLISVKDAHSNIGKPGMVNIVPNPSRGRVDQTRRAIRIR